MKKSFSAKLSFQGVVKLFSYKCQQFCHYLLTTVLEQPKKEQGIINYFYNKFFVDIDGFLLVTWFTYVLKLLQLTYDLAKFDYCTIYAENLRNGIRC